MKTQVFFLNLVCIVNVIIFRSLPKFSIFFFIFLLYAEYFQRSLAAGTALGEIWKTLIQLRKNPFPDIFPLYNAGEFAWKLLQISWIGFATISNNERYGQKIFRIALLRNWFRVLQRSHSDLKLFWRFRVRLSFFYPLKADSYSYFHFWSFFREKIVTLNELL